MSRHVRRNPVVRRVKALGSLVVVVAFVTLLVSAAVGLGGEPSNTAQDLGARSTPPGSVPVPKTDGSSTASSAPTTPAAEKVQPSEEPTVVSSDVPPQKVKQAGRKLAREVEKPKVFSFRVGTYNILGSQHKRNGTGRASTSAGLILDRGLDLVGMQEVQRDQLGVMESRLGGFSIWPGTSLGNQGIRHQIAYRDSMFELLDTGSVTYTFDSQRIPLPYVLLRDRATGGEFYFITGHNSAGNMEGQRDDATNIEIALINQLKSTGRPVFIVGDMNEHTEFFCSVAGATGLVAANGGGYSGGCQLPGGPLRVDWIMGGGGQGVDFSGYVQDGASLSTGASDHYFLHADVTVTTLLSSVDDTPDS